MTIYGYKTKGYGRDVGNLEEYIEANMDVLKGKLSYINVSDKRGNCISRKAKIDRKAEIDNSIIGDDVVIEKDAVIKNSVVWNNVKISSGSRLLFDV